MCNIPAFNFIQPTDTTRRDEPTTVRLQTQSRQAGLHICSLVGREDRTNGVADATPNGTPLLSNFDGKIMGLRQTRLADNYVPAELTSFSASFATHFPDRKYWVPLTLSARKFTFYLMFEDECEFYGEMRKNEEENELGKV